MFELRISGFVELERALRQLPHELAGKVLAEGLTTAATPMERAAEQKAPRSDHPGRGGHMADTIDLRVASASDQEIALALGPDDQHFYGRYVEFGTRFAAAQPFMRPAFDEEARKTIDRLGPLLWQAIERAARRLHQPGTGGR